MAQEKLFVYLDDTRPLAGGYDVLVKTAEEAIDLIKTGTVEEISLDWDLGTGYTMGHKVAEFIEQAYEAGEIEFVEFHPHTSSEYGFELIMEIRRRMYQKHGV